MTRRNEWDVAVILVDTSVWIDHLRVGSPTLTALLDLGEVMGHPWVAGELALGRISNRTEVLALLSHLPQAVVATSDEVLMLVELAELSGAGIGYVDAQLLASTRLTADAQLWSRDRRLVAAAARAEVATVRVEWS